MQQGAILSVLRSCDWAKASCLQAVFFSADGCLAAIGKG